MADINNTTNELEVKDNIENEEVPGADKIDVEDKKEIEELEKPAEEQEKESLFSKIKNKFYGTEKKEEVKDKEVEETVREDLEEDIDNEFTQAALKAGWTEKDVVEFAGKYNNTELRQLIPYLTGKEKEEKEETKEVVKEDKVEVDKNLEATVDKLMKALDAKYQEKIGQLEERLSKVDEERSVQEQVRYQTTADKVFDRAAKDFPVFGKTEELLRFPEGTPQAGQLVPAGEAFEARNAVWKTAVAFNKMGMSWDAALDEALDWYKGKNMEKEIHGKVVKELKGQQKRLSPKRAEHVTEKKYTNEAEEKADVVLEAARKAGVKGI